MVLGVSKNDLLQDLWWPPLGLNYWFATRLAGLKSWLHSRLHQKLLVVDEWWVLSSPHCCRKQPLTYQAWSPFFYRFRFEIYFFLLVTCFETGLYSFFLATQSFSHRIDWSTPHDQKIQSYGAVGLASPIIVPMEAWWKLQAMMPGGQGHLLRVWEGAGRRGSRRGLKLSVAMNIAKKRFLITNSGLLMPKVGLGLYEFIWFYTLVSKV